MMTLEEEIDHGACKAPIGTLVLAREESVREFDLGTVVAIDESGEWAQVKWVINDSKTWIPRIPYCFQSTEVKRRRLSQPSAPPPPPQQLAPKRIRTKKSVDSFPAIPEASDENINSEPTLLPVSDLAIPMDKPPVNMSDTNGKFVEAEWKYDGNIYDDSLNSICMRYYFENRELLECLITQKIYLGLSKLEFPSTNTIKSFDNIIINKSIYFNHANIREYQMSGLKWLIKNYESCCNCVVAYERGLGNLFLIINFLNYLADTCKKIGPYLILTTSPSYVWTIVREFHRWCPSFFLLPITNLMDTYDPNIICQPFLNWKNQSYFRSQEQENASKSNCASHEFSSRLYLGYVTILTYEAYNDLKSNYLDSIQWETTFTIFESNPAELSMAMSINASLSTNLKVVVPRDIECLLDANNCWLILNTLHPILFENKSEFINDGESIERLKTSIIMSTDIITSNNNEILNDDNEVTNNNTTTTTTTNNNNNNNDTNGKKDEEDDVIIPDKILRYKKALSLFILSYSKESLRDTLLGIHGTHILICPMTTSQLYLTERIFLLDAHFNIFLTLLNKDKMSSMEWIAKRSKKNFLSTLQRIWNYCWLLSTHPILLSNELLNKFEEAYSQKNICFLSTIFKMSGKFLALKSLLNMAYRKQHRIALFYENPIILQLLKAFLFHLGYKYCCVNNNVDKTLCKVTMHRFNDLDSDLFICLVHVDGLEILENLELYGANIVLLFDTQGNFDSQSVQSVNVIGQLNPIKVIRFVGKGSVEESVFNTRVSQWESYVYVEDEPEDALSILLDGNKCFESRQNQNYIPQHNLDNNAFENIPLDLELDVERKERKQGYEGKEDISVGDFPSVPSLDGTSSKTTTKYRSVNHSLASSSTDISAILNEETVGGT